MRRREFIAILGVAGARPLAASAQQPERLRRIGALMAWAEQDPGSRAGVAALTQALAGFGWAEGKNLHIDWRFAAGNPTLFDKYAAELVGFAPDAIFASTDTSLAAVHRHTTAIPTVFVLVANPVEMGYARSLARPGGNITGFSSFYPSLMTKWMQLIKEISPSLKHVGVIFNPHISGTYAPGLNSEISAAAPTVGVSVGFAEVQSDAEIIEAIASLAREPASGLVALPDAFLTAHRDMIIDAAIRHGLPLISPFARSGGLMSYWFDGAALHGEAATYIDRILRGADAGELPIQYPTKFTLVINLKTAQAIGLSVPQSLLARADEVIE